MTVTELTRPAPRAAVIMAGGSGTRLWPLSRRNRPKQLLRILSGRSLLRDAFDRLAAILPADAIYVIALAEHLPAISQELPDLPAQNLIGEPVGRDTAAAIALSASILHKKDPQTIMGVFTADHVIRPADRFAQIITHAFETAARYPKSLLTFGVRPTSPHVGMGYLQRGEEVEPGLWRVKAFKEKPDLKTAQSYLASGDYRWNAGMFLWPTQTILAELEKQLPGTYRLAQEMAEHGSHDGAFGQAAAYASLEKISIDFAVMEKSSGVFMLEMDLEWLDIGHWTALPAVLGQDAAGNTLSGERIAQLAGRNNIIVSEGIHIIATIGVQDLVIVHSADATLVCRRDQLDKLKDLVAKIHQDLGDAAL